MSAYLPKEKKTEIIAEHGGSATNTGSTAAQIALFTFRIQQLSNHLRENRKDNSCKRALLTLVGKRKRLLSYMQNRDIKQYRELLEKLNIRK
jgi:small subunit ribosomal protein S15